MGSAGGWWRWWRRAPKQVPVLRARVERTREAIGRFNDRARSALEPQVSATTLHDLLVVFDELLANVVMHAEQAAGAIEVEIARENRTIVATISYLAAEFDPTTWRASAAGATIATSRIGGLGITLVRRLVDELRYEYVDGRNRLTLRKRAR